MTRREFITLLGGAVAAWPVVAQSQQPVKLPTIGLLGAGTRSGWTDWVAAFVQRLRELGWTPRELPGVHVDLTVPIRFNLR
jgi:putative ABC transport system substrate-binding protein